MIRIIHHDLYICGFLQDEVTEDDIDDSFKSMFAQLAGEVSSEKKKNICFESLFASVLAIANTILIILM